MVCHIGDIAARERALRLKLICRARLRRFRRENRAGRAALIFNIFFFGGHLAKLLFVCFVRPWRSRGRARGGLGGVWTGFARKLKKCHLVHPGGLEGKLEADWEGCWTALRLWLLRRRLPQLVRFCLCVTQSSYRAAFLTSAEAIPFACAAKPARSPTAQNRHLSSLRPAAAKHGASAQRRPSWHRCVPPPRPSPRAAAYRAPRAGLCRKAKRPPAPGTHASLRDGCRGTAARATRSRRSLGAAAGRAPK